MNTKAGFPDAKRRGLLDLDPPMSIQRVAVIGNYLPRLCGIATFTTDLCEALVNEYEHLQCQVLAVNDTETGYEYPPRVRFELEEQDLSSYHRAANFLELRNIDLVNVQHEFGIFGGKAGRHILSLLHELRMPIVTTLHTVLQEPPEPEYGEVFQELVQLSDRLVVISHKAIELLQNLHQVPREKIDLIPHGIHDTPFIDPNFYKDKFGIEGKWVILTFGLLGPAKGIEYAIQAMPEICRKHPNVVYVVLGATHPYWLRTVGEQYRESLEALARDLGMEKHVIFHNRFVGIEELLEHIGAADAYITPYLAREQISSGTLAYALGAGKAVVSTPYWYAEELLADGRGRLVPFKDAGAIAREIIDLLDHPTELHATRKRAYMYGREMIWPKVARRYMRSFARAREERVKQPRAVYHTSSSLLRPIELPAIKLTHLQQLTDDTGIAQHAICAIPNYDHGYTTDDNARALVLAVLLEEIDLEQSVEVRNLASTYLAFLWHAFNKDRGRFRNVLGYERRWLDEIGSEDCHGRALWAAGTTAGRSSDRRLRGAAARLFSLSLPAVLETRSPRCWAFALLGIHEYMRRFFGDHAALTTRKNLAERLIDLYRNNSASEEWPWFEDTVSYDNAKLAHALLLSGRWIPDGEMVDIGLKSLDWLIQIQRCPEGRFSPIGSKGFYPRGGERAYFDQQPIEAHATVSACLEAHVVTGDEKWQLEAQRVFEWFLGQNALKLPVYDAATGGCCDALHPDRTNSNQGAESTIAFLLSLVEMHLSNSVLAASESVPI
ncbi:MAG: glycosyltransferase family 4 protein [Planctomycetota bacterium]